MASSLGYVQYVASQLADAGVITYKKLFGEYGLWCGGKFFGTVEDNQFYVKMTNAGRLLLPDAEPAAPHGGEPGMYLVENLDDADFLAKQRKYMAQITENDVQIHSKEGAGTV